MKKLVGLVILIGLYLGAAYYTGYQGEKNIRHQFELSAQQSAAQGVKLVLNDYKRGIFSSEINFSGTYGDLKLPIPFGPITVTSHTKMQHGPILFRNGFGLGLFSSSSTLELTTGEDDLDQSIKELFGDSIGEIITRGHFNNSYTAVWTLPALERADETSTFSLAESRVEVTGSYSNLDFVGVFVLGAMEFAELEDETKLSIAPINGKFDVHNISPLVNISNMDLAIENIHFANPDSPGFGIEKFGYVQKQALVNNKIDTSVSMTAEKIHSPVEISSFYYDITMNQIDPAAIEKWLALYQKIYMEAPDAEAAVPAEQEVMDIMELLLQEGLQLKLAMGADFMDGSARLDLTADYKSLSDGRKVSDIENPQEYLSLVDAVLMVSVSESIVTQTPLALMVGEYIDTYITLEGDNYRMHGKLQAGQLSIGSVDMPAAMLLALLGGGQAEEQGSYEGQAEGQQEGQDETHYEEHFEEENGDDQGYESDEEMED